MELVQNEMKDIGLQRLVLRAYPYAVVGGSFEGSFQAQSDLYTVLNHIVPAGQQLKILFLRVWTQEADGAKFSIIQTNPSAAGATGSVEAYEVRGSVPPFTAGQVATRDYPMLEAAGCEVLRGGLDDPVHVLEGSITFNILYSPAPATGARYGIVWWGVEKDWSK